MWSIFKKTGNIQAYLYCKEYSNYTEITEEQKVNVDIQLFQTNKTNSI